MSQSRLQWQSKLVLLLVVPAAATDVALRTQWWVGQPDPVALWVLCLSGLLGLITWNLRAATPAGASTGAILTASLMYSTTEFPYQPWHTAILPVLAVSLLAFASTKLGRAQKERLGTAEKREGRSASQIAANLGVAALVCSDFALAWTGEHHWLPRLRPEDVPLLIVGLAALSEAAADTVSSELGQVFGGRPRMITTLRTVEPGVDGAISIAGTLAGAAAAAVIAAVGTYALRGGLPMFAIASAGGIFGLLFDSLLGATLERIGWLNNDGVNFLSTASAAGCALVALIFLR